MHYLFIPRIIIALAALVHVVRKHVLSSMSYFTLFRAVLLILFQFYLNILLLLPSNDAHVLVRH
jgi:hypothetical protein